MIKYSLRFTRKADEDEADIYKYIAEQFGEIYADQFRASFIQFCELLRKQPAIGRPAKNDTSLRIFILLSKISLCIKQKTIAWSLSAS